MPDQPSNAKGSTPGLARGSATQLSQILQQDATALCDDWVAEQVGARQAGHISAADLRSQCQEFLGLLSRAAHDAPGDMRHPGWDATRKMLENVSRSRALQGFSPSETAQFIFSLKRPLFTRVRERFVNDAQKLADETWTATYILDTLGLYTTEVFQQSREQLIHRQQQDMLELSTPVVTLWEGVLALPMIGTLDSARTQVAMEALLERIVEEGADVAIIDITGVPTVDTLTAQHLLKTVTATRLMGADAIISGIRPQIAQTIVQLGVDLGNVTTKATLADALRVALERSGRTVVRSAKADRSNRSTSET